MLRTARDDRMQMLKRNSHSVLRIFLFRPSWSSWLLCLENDEKIIPTKAEIRLIIENAPESHRVMFVTAIFTGMRISELRGLTWDCVDLDRRIIKIAKRADEFGEMGAPKCATYPWPRSYTRRSQRGVQWL